MVGLYSFALFLFRFLVAGGETVPRRELPRWYHALTLGQRTTARMRELIGKAGQMPSGYTR